MSENYIYPMNLQLFAEEQAETTEEKESEAVEEPKTYTEEEVKAQIQAEADRRVTKALETAKGKWEAEKEQELKQTEELAKLSADERLKKEEEIRQQKFQEDRKKFEQERQGFHMERLTLQAEKDLISKNLPVDFAGLLVAETAEKTLENINGFEASWQAALQKEIDARIQGATPKTSKQEYNGITPDAFKKMGYLERVELNKQDPKLYEKLKGE